MFWPYNGIICVESVGGIWTRTRSETLKKSSIGLITARKRSLRRLCFHRCLSVHRGVPGQVPPSRYTSRQVPPPPGQVHPPGRYTPGQQAGGTHPNGMHSCININVLNCTIFLHIYLIPPSGCRKAALGK